MNLDAIIRREDWEAMPAMASSDVQAPSGISFKAIEFEETGLAFQLLRKPEFQRETASWEPKKVADLVECFFGRRPDSLRYHLEEPQER